jgi:putative nucleotidyltransferase with HDIG domain
LKRLLVPESGTIFLLEHNVPEFEKLKAFLASLAAVSQTHYQIWDTKGRKIFSTNKQKTDSPATSAHLNMAKKVVLSHTFTYTPVDHNGFLCGTPLEMDSKTQGALLAMGRRPATANGNGHCDRLNSFLEQVLRLVDNEKHDEEDHYRVRPRHSHRSFEDLYLFANISKQFRSLRFKQPVLGKLMLRLFDSMDADAAFLQLPQLPKYSIVEVRPNLSESGHAPNTTKASLQQLITTSIDQLVDPSGIIHNSTKHPILADLSDRPFRLMSVAVRHMKDVLGWIGLVSYNMDRDYGPSDLYILETLANQLAAMAANMDRYDHLERFTVNLVCSLVNAIEGKDAYSRGHSKRVCQYTMQMAEQMQFTVKEMEALKWASLLHDIGKIGIPERILRKPGKLTEEEFNRIKEHPEKGKAILAPLRQIAPSMDAIVHHHEKYNGTGYPQGLKGDAIPLAARIISVADTFDALTCKRSYHRIKTPQEAMLVLDQVSGTQLDPALVKVFKVIYRQLYRSGFKNLKQVPIVP